MATQIFDSYNTNGSNLITLTAQTGHGQGYVSAVLLEGVALIVRPPADADGNYRGNFTLDLSPYAPLQNKLLLVTSDATIFMAPPLTSIILTLSGGAAPQSYVMDDAGTGLAVGDVVDSYYASITLI